MSRSRGELTADFLRGAMTPQIYLQDVRRRAHEYAAFSLIVGDAETLWYFPTATRGHRLQ